MTVVAASQLRIWAHNIRQAADDLFPPGELAHTDQELTEVPEETDVGDLLSARHGAGGHRLVARDNLYGIAAALEEAADS